MWLIIVLYAAAIATALWYINSENDVYMLKYLALILWGAAIMILVDHVVGYLQEGGEFLETTVDATILGFILVLGALILWELILLIKDPKRVIRRTRH